MFGRQKYPVMSEEEIHFRSEEEIDQRNNIIIDQRNNIIKMSIHVTSEHLILKKIEPPTLEELMILKEVQKSATPMRPILLRNSDLTEIFRSHYDGFLLSALIKVVSDQDFAKALKAARNGKEVKPRS